MQKSGLNYKIYLLYIIKKSLYVIVGPHWELELSNKEINYRAELYLKSKLQII